MTNNFQTIVRINHNKENPFVQLSKETLWDDRLSLKAIGLWSRCMSRPDDWTFNITELVARCKEGRRSVDSAMEELIEIGLAARFEISTRSNGKFTGRIIQYMIFEYPISPIEREAYEKDFKNFYRDCGFSNCRDGNCRNVELPKTETETEKEVYRVNDKKPSLTPSIPKEKSLYLGKAKYTDEQKAILDWLKGLNLDTDDSTLSWWARKYDFKRLQDVYKEAKKRAKRSIAAYMQTLLRKDAIVSTDRIEENREFAQDFKDAHQWYDLEIYQKYAKFHSGNAEIELDFNRDPLDFAQYIMEKYSIHG